MDIERIKEFLNGHEKRLKVLEAIDPTKVTEYDVDSAIKFLKNSIKEYQKCIDKTSDEHKQLCESLKKEFPKFITEDYDLKTLRAFNKVMNDDSLSEIEKSTWYMLIGNYQK